VTTFDLTAVEPGESADKLAYSVSNLRNGHIALASSPTTPVHRFTQADLEAGRVLFVHNGEAAPLASFDVVVTDHLGVSSGASQKVNLAVSV
jgi:hypothetical protein